MRALLLFALLLGVQGITRSVDRTVKDFFEAPGHTNNWAVLVCTSRFWLNYRHVANVLSLYHSIKRLGIPDSNIIMMLADDIPCNHRNPYPGSVFGRAENRFNLYGNDIEVDYRGYEVTVENFIRVMTGRVHPATPRSKRLLSDHQSNVLVYLTGHGGPHFMKFQDSAEITSQDVADMIEAMFQGNRYHELLFIADSCKSATMYGNIYSPNVLATSSSLADEDAFSHHIDHSLGVHVIDRYTYYTVDFLEKEVRSLQANKSMVDYFDSCSYRQCASHVGVRTDLYQKNPERVRLTDFFGSNRKIRAVNEDIEFDDEWMASSPEATTGYTSETLLQFERAQVGVDESSCVMGVCAF
uniref:GPI-anchor transamidase n=1 Tax=Steinernema glaseri TaxID=37863 RepID=A0A1I7ZHL3_9BILA